jgi:hypothetical protein
MVGEGAVTVRRVGGMLWLRADEAKKKACVCVMCDVVVKGRRNKRPFDETDF